MATPHSALTEVSVTIALDGVLLQDEHGRATQLPWEHFTEMGKAGLRWRLAGAQWDATTQKHVPFYVLLDQESAYVEIRERWQQANPQRARSSMDAESKLLIWKLVGITAFIVGILALAYFAFLHLYWIVPVSFDQRVGELVHQTTLVHQGSCEDSSMQRFIAKAQVALRLPSDQFEHPMTIVPDQTVNAFAIPGGRIYLHQGLLQKSESPDEILGVLAHEIAHSELRHGTQQMWRGMGLTLLLAMTFDPGALTEIARNLASLQYSRDFERAADQEAVARLHGAKIKAEGLDSLLMRISPKGVDTLLTWMSSHPMGADRAQVFRDAKSQEQFEADTVFRWERANWKSIRKPSCK